MTTKAYKTTKARQKAKQKEERAKQTQHQPQNKMEREPMTARVAKLQNKRRHNRASRQQRKAAQPRKR